MPSDVGEPINDELLVSSELIRPWGRIVLRMADRKGYGRTPAFPETLALGEHVYPHRYQAMAE
jgi:hypothetical protein